MDPSAQLPAPVDVADSESRLVSLCPALSDQAGRSLIFAFFQAMVKEDLDAMADLVTSDANAPSKTRGSTVAVMDYMRSRMSHFRYQALAGEPIYQDSDLEFYGYDDLEGTLPGRPARPPEMVRSDMLVRAPIMVTRMGADRLFGDEILLLLRRDASRLRIRQLIEDFQVP